jgi:hypothetical protein
MTDPVRPSASRPFVPPASSLHTASDTQPAAGAVSQSAAAPPRPLAGSAAPHAAQSEAPLAAGAQQLVANAERVVRPRADALAPSQADPLACVPVPLTQDPLAAQARIDRAAQEVGLHFRQQPHYGQTSESAKP